MDEVLRRQPRRMDAPALEDRHAVLDPQHRPRGIDLRQQEAGPAAVARMRGEQFGEGGARRLWKLPVPLRRQGTSPAKPFQRCARLGSCLRRSTVSAGPERAKTAPPATRDKPLATRLTTFLFYFCSYLASRLAESIARLGAFDFLEETADLAHHVARGAGRNAERHVGAIELDRLVALMLEPARRARRDRARPCATTRPAAAPAACPSRAGSAAGRPCGARSARKSARHCSAWGRPRKGSRA